MLTMPPSDVLVSGPKRLVTAQVFYRLPDYRSILQFFVLQKEDEVPECPRILEFLEFWSRSIEGPLHSVEVKWPGLGAPRALRHFGAGADLRLH